MKRLEREGWPRGSPSPRTPTPRKPRTSWAILVVGVLLLTILPFSIAAAHSAPSTYGAAKGSHSSASEAHPAVRAAVNTTSPATFHLVGTNGSLELNVTLQLTNVSQQVFANASGMVTWAGSPLPASPVVSWGDGNVTNTSNNGSGYFQASHWYVTPGSALLMIQVTLPSHRTALVQTTILVPGSAGNGSGGNTTRWVGYLRLTGGNGSLQVNVNFSLNSTGGLGYLAIRGQVVAGSAPFVHNESYGDTALSGGVTYGGSFSLNHTYLASGNYTLIIRITDHNGTQANGSAILTVPASRGTGSGGPPFHVALVSYTTLLNGSLTTAFNVSFVNTSLGWVNYTLLYGDGGRVSGSLISTGNTSFPAYHTYPRSLVGTNFTAGLFAVDSNLSNAYTLIAVYPTYAWVNHTGNGSGGNQTPVQLNGTNGTFHLVLNLTYLANNTSFQVVVNGDIWGGTAPYSLNMTLGGGKSSGITWAGNIGTSIFGLGTAGNYTFLAYAKDANNTTIMLSTLIHAWFNPGGNGSGGGPPPPYPAPVTVVVAATPVQGYAPLGVTLSAYLQGGAPPFQVVWSLPGSSTGPNSSGLSTVGLYAHPGWYPATAFVYNTTNPYGTVLVGYASVWIHVLGGGSGGGNGSGNHSGKSAPPARLTSAGNPPVVGMNMLLLETLLIGAAFGALVGYVFGGTRPRLSSPTRKNRSGDGPPGSRL